MCSLPRPRSSRAFNLIQLLAVIALIVLLLAIIVPILSRVRQQAKQANCMSNLRQLSIVYTLYANSYGGCVPLGYTNGMPWNGYFLWDGTGFPVSGRLFVAGLLDTAPQAFYCPAQSDPRWQFNTPQNVWPSHTVAPIANTLIRVGYTSRPTVLWDAGSAAPNGHMSQLTQLQGKAILADIVGIPQNSPEATSIHNRRINVLYGDTSVRSIDMTVYGPIQSQIQPYAALPYTVPLTLYINNASPATALWNTLDTK